MLTRIYKILKGKFDDSDVDSPLEYKYIKSQRLLMSSIGCWPHKQFNNRYHVAHSMYNILLILIALTLPILEAAYSLQHWHDITFFDLGHSILCIMMAILVLTYKDIHIVSGMFTLYVQCLMYSGIILFNLKPWYNNYSRGLLSNLSTANITLEQAVYYYSPDDFAYTTKTGYWILLIANMPLSYFITCGLCAFDLLVSTIVLQILGHIKILKHNLLTFPLPLDLKSGMYTIEENIKIRQILKENIEHHKFIINFVDKCSDALSEYSFVFYLILQIMCCILLLEISAMTFDVLAKYGPLTVGIYQQLIHLSVFFELINSKSVQLIDAVYETPWECMDTSNRKTVLLMLLRAQTPLSFKAGKIVPVGVRTMAAILKTSVSYYMMLVAMAGER